MIVYKVLDLKYDTIFWFIVVVVDALLLDDVEVVTSCCKILVKAV